MFSQVGHDGIHLPQLQTSHKETESKVVKKSKSAKPPKPTSTGLPSIPLSFASAHLLKQDGGNEQKKTVEKKEQGPSITKTQPVSHRDSYESNSLSTYDSLSSSSQQHSPMMGKNIANSSSSSITSLSPASHATGHSFFVGAQHPQMSLFDLGRTSSSPIRALRLESVMQGIQALGIDMSNLSKPDEHKDIQKAHTNRQSNDSEQKHEQLDPDALYVYEKLCLISQQRQKEEQEEQQTSDTILNN